MADQIYLLRVKLSPASANLASAYQYFSGHAPGVSTPQWSSSLDDAVPLIDWPRHTGTTNVVWLPEVRRFLMFVTTPTNGTGAGAGVYDSWIAEAEVLTGPWRLVKYMSAFGPQGYFLNAPSAFLRGGDAGDNATSASGWLWYSAKWSLPAGSKIDPPFCAADMHNCYGSELGEFTLALT